MARTNDAERPLMTRRALSWVFLIGVPALVATVALLTFDAYLFPPSSFEADSFSRSALGYRALPALLRSWGYGTFRSRCASAERVGPDDLLVLLEPELEHEHGRLSDLVTTARARGAHVLVVLPKWRGIEDHRNPGWVKSIRPIPSEEVDEVLEALALPGTPQVIRPQGSRREGWYGTLSVTPQVPAPQLLSKPGALSRTVVWHEAGGLIVRYDAEDLTVIADPDVVNNAGLARGMNATLLERLLPHEIRPRSVVIDETCHGYFLTDSFWVSAVRFPLVLVTASLGALLVLVLWRSFERFGGFERVPPRLAPGKAGLLDNTAGLLVMGGHTETVVRAYYRLNMQLAAQGLGVRSGAAELAALSRARKAAHDPVELGETVRRLTLGRHAWRAALASARAIYRWRRTVLKEDAAREKNAAGQGVQPWI